MLMKAYKSITFCLFLFVLCSCIKDQGRLSPPAQVTCASLNITYAADVKPIILNYCATPLCHASSGAGPGDYTQYNIVKFTVDQGLFQNRTFVLKDMPPPPDVPLHDSLIRKLKCWIDNGALNN